MFKSSLPSVGGIDGGKKSNKNVAKWDEKGYYSCRGPPNTKNKCSREDRLIFLGERKGTTRAMRFSGTYRHTVDSKGRVSLPSKFRKVLPENLTMTKMFSKNAGNCLLVFSDEAYDEYIDSFFAEKDYNPKSRSDIRLRRMLTSGAAMANIDSAGRIKIPEDLAAEVGIDKKVVVVGEYDHIEIWDEQEWDNESADAAAALDSLLED